MAVVTLNNLGKKYKRYTHKRHRLLEWIFGGNIIRHELVWVLRNISFTVNCGEAVGVIGENGAGKSTLLKLLSGTTAPSEGSYRLEGRVAALLELGLGFHPDFTGRQNVFLTNQMMGFNNYEIEKLMPDVENFAEIGNYFNQPLRTYSSGMILRLAFAAVTAVRPEVLLVDEVLSVGDAYFQHKCFDRIRSFKEQGTTLLLVSHDPGAVKNLCDRAVLLEKGLIIKEGNPEDVLDYYNAVIARHKANYIIKQSRSIGGWMVTRSGNRAAQIKEVNLYSEGKPVFAVQTGDMAKIAVTVEFLTQMVNPTVGILLRDRLGNDIFGTNTCHLGLNLGECGAGRIIEVVFTLPLNLGAGHYNVTAAVHSGPTHLKDNYDWWDHAVTLQVIPGEEPAFTGVCHIPGVSVRLGHG